jgi:hypothetical protein
MIYDGSNTASLDSSSFRFARSLIPRAASVCAAERQRTIGA